MVGITKRKRQKMKKYIYMAVAVIAALSSCSSDNDPIVNEIGETGKQALIFTATMEGGETRATYDSENKCASWEVDDQISINGKTYNAQSEGISTTFRAAVEGQEAVADEGKYKAYFPANLYNDGTPTLPAIQTYNAGKFDMPMYATSTTTSLEFKNLCAVLAVKVTSEDITTLKSIKVKSDKALSGAFTVSENKAVLTNANDNSKTVELVSETPLSLDAEGTTFYIAIPAQTYQYLNIYLSDDGIIYKEVMATKKAAGLGEIARSKIFNINYEKNAVQLWEAGPYFALKNITYEIQPGIFIDGLYRWGGSTHLGTDYVRTGYSPLSGQNDTATKLWGSNWRIPSKTDFDNLWIPVNPYNNCTYALDEVYVDYLGRNVQGMTFTGKGAYSSCSVFFPRTSSEPNNYYWSSTPYPTRVEDAYVLSIFISSSDAYPNSYNTYRTNYYPVRPVLADIIATSGRFGINDGEGYDEQPW